MGIETRMTHEPVTLRADGSSKKLEGYAAMFNRETTIGDWFREVIAPGAFAVALKDSDARGLFNHDPNQVLGREKSKTMALTEDERGLRYSIDIPDTTTARDVLALVERGDVTGSSFAFTIKSESWTKADSATGLPLRTITEVDWIRDVGPVTFPAYEETTAAARASATATQDDAPVREFVAALSRRAHAELAQLEAE